MIENPLYSCTDNNEVENPFTISNDSANVTVVVEGTILYVNDDILKVQSPVFNAMLSDRFKEGQQKKIELPGKKACDIIRMFKFFYPDKKIPVTSKFDFYAILGLCEEYQLDWLTNMLTKFIELNFANICNAMDSKANDMALYFLYLSEQFKISDLKEKCLQYSFTSSFLQLKSIKVFHFLSKESRLFIFKYCLNLRLKKRDTYSSRKISFKTAETDDDALLNYIKVIADKKYLVKPTLTEDTAKKRKIEEQIEKSPKTIITMVVNPLSKISSKTKADTTENPFNIANELNDVTLVVENVELFLNSGILQVHAPVLWKHLSQSFTNDGEQNVVLEDVKAVEIINLLCCLHPVKETPLQDSSDFCSLIYFCTKYKIDWLKNKITNYILERLTTICPVKDSNEIHLQSSVPDKMVIYFLYLAEQFNIGVLKEKCFQYSFQSYFINLRYEPAFLLLSYESRWLIYKYCLKRRMLMTDFSWHSKGQRLRLQNETVCEDDTYLCTYIDEISHTEGTA